MPFANAPAIPGRYRVFIHGIGYCDAEFYRDQADHARRWFVERCHTGAKYRPDEVCVIKRLPDALR